jgi:DNA-binding NarL/FixJ family response regulator
MSIRIVIIDGHTLTRYGLTGLIAQHSDLKLVGETGSMAEAPRVVAAVQPDVVTVDAALPDGHGLQLAQELRARSASLGIVMLTSDSGDEALFRSLETGASAFVAKTASITEVLAAIRHAAMAADSFTAFGLAPALARRNGENDRSELNPREREVLHRLGAGMSIPEIARSMFLSHSTAKMYVARIYVKLGASNRAQAVMTGVRCGPIQHDAGQPEVAEPLAARTFAPRRKRMTITVRIGSQVGDVSVISSGEPKRRCRKIPVSFARRLGPRRNCRNVRL